MKSFLTPGGWHEEKSLNRFEVRLHINDWVALEPLLMFVSRNVFSVFEISAVK